MMALQGRRYFGQQLLLQTVVVLCVFLLLAVTPAPVTFPSGPWEAVLLLKGAAALIAANLILTSAGRGVDHDRGAAPGWLGKASNPHRFDHYHVVDEMERAGVVDEVVVNRGGKPTALIVARGWWKQQRFVVGLDQVRVVDDSARTIIIDPFREEAL